MVGCEQGDGRRGEQQHQSSRELPSWGWRITALAKHMHTQHPALAALCTPHSTLAAAPTHQGPARGCPRRRRRAP